MTDKRLRHEADVRPEHQYYDVPASRFSISVQLESIDRKHSVGESCI